MSGLSRARLWPIANAKKLSVADLQYKIVNELIRGDKHRCSGDDVCPLQNAFRQLEQEADRTYEYRTLSSHVPKKLHYWERT